MPVRVVAARSACLTAENARHWGGGMAFVKVTPERDVALASVGHLGANWI